MSTAVIDERTVGRGAARTSYDVIVVGGGLAGYCAAAEAANHGASVLLLEREARNGGATVLSGGSFAFAGTDVQAKAGIADSETTLFDDLQRVGGYKNDEALVRVYVDGQLDAYRWLGRLGVFFERLFIASGQSVPRAHSRNARHVLDRVVAAAERSGVETRMSSRVHRLLRDGIGAPVRGVSVTSNGNGGDLVEIEARCGVVLATGGFSRNERLLELFAPAQAKAQRMGGAGNLGDGLLMAWEHGAALKDMGHIKGTFGSHPSAGAEDHFILFPIYAGAIAVNRDARRFADESRSYKLIGDACLKQPDCVAFQIFDADIFAGGQPGIPAMDFAADLRDGRVVTAPTLAQLSALIGIDAGRLQSTVDEYNAAIREGRKDAFGRQSLCSGFGAPVPIARSPFYAYASTSVVLATYCGLAVDAQMRVRNVFDDVIEGLYAAGGVIGGFHGVAYMTGTANGKATIFGRIAGREAAARKPR